MRRLCMVGALLVVLVANGWGVWQARINRSEPRGGTLRLTERELPLQAIALESSVTILRLNWRTQRTGNERFGPAAWLDHAKLAELGFDCSVPLNSAKARRHYSSMPSRRVFLALEYELNASQPAPAQSQPQTGLVVVDAAQNAGLLRERYADTGKYAICRGSVRLALHTFKEDGGGPDNPRLEGWVEGLLPEQVLVPRPANRLLAQFLRTSDEQRNSRAVPRFSAVIHWGKNFEPWVDDVRPASVSSNP